MFFTILFNIPISGPLLPVFHVPCKVCHGYDSWYGGISFGEHLQWTLCTDWILQNLKKSKKNNRYDSHDTDVVEQTWYRKTITPYTEDDDGVWGEGRRKTSEQIYWKSHLELEPFLMTYLLYILYYNRIFTWLDGILKLLKFSSFKGNFLRALPVASTPSLLPSTLTFKHCVSLFFYLCLLPYLQICLPFLPLDFPHTPTYKLS